MADADVANGEAGVLDAEPAADRSDDADDATDAADAGDVTDPATDGDRPEP